MSYQYCLAEQQGANNFYAIDNNKNKQMQSPCFVITEILLNGEASEQFQWALHHANTEAGPALGRCLDAVSIDKILREMNHAIHFYGYTTTHIVIPAQNISQGKLEFTVLPGRIRNIQYMNDTKTKVVELPYVKSGDLVNIHHLDRVIKESAHYMNVVLKGDLVPIQNSGSKKDDRDLLIKVEEKNSNTSTLADI